MLAALAMHGPDGVGAWHDGPVALGHRMLWTTPESLHEQQPTVNSAADLVITADARIDNRKELIDLLRPARMSPNPITDSELILAAYERWGHDCPEHLAGDFAFAIWDRRNRRLFCARDRFGIRPFYFFESPTGFVVFGSEIRAF